MSKKKEKITYVDDGRTICDMSQVQGGWGLNRKGTTSPVSEIWKTYWNAVKMMFRPTLVAVGFLLAVYAIVTLVFYLL